MLHVLFLEFHGRGVVWRHEEGGRDGGACVGEGLEYVSSPLYVCVCVFASG